MTDEEARAILELQNDNRHLATVLHRLRERLMRLSDQGLTQSLCEWRYKHMLSHARAITSICEPMAMGAELRLGYERTTATVYEGDPPHAAG